MSTTSRNWEWAEHTVRADIIQSVLLVGDVDTGDGELGGVVRSGTSS